MFVFLICSTGWLLCWFFNSPILTQEKSRHQMDSPVGTTISSREAVEARSYEMLVKSQRMTTNITMEYHYFFLMGRYILKWLVFQCHVSFQGGVTTMTTGASKIWTLCSTRFLGMENLPNLPKKLLQFWV